MKIKFLLSVVSAALIASAMSACAQPSPGYPNALVVQPVVKGQCAVWTESSQNYIQSASCGAGGGTPGGLDTQMQRNNAGGFGGITGATSDGTTVTLTNPTFINPALGTPASGVGTNITGLNASNLSSGTVAATRMPAFSGDVTTSAGSTTTTLATVNSNVGTFGDATHCANFTVNAKGLITAAAQSTSCPGGGGGSVSVTSASSNIVINPSPGTGTFTVGATYLTRTVTSGTDTISSSDLGKLVIYNNAASVAVTLPQATGSFGNGASFDVQNKNSGSVTITPTTSTINGSATLVIGQNQGCSITSDGTNYQVSACTAVGATGSGTVNSGTSGQVAYYASNGTTISGSNLGTGVLTALGTNLSAAGGVSSTVASGTSALGTSAIASGTCATAVTTSATNVATTDVILAGFNGDPTAVTGYAPVTSGMLTIISYPSANNVNFKVCNNTTASITPGAITLNWRVVR